MKVVISCGGTGGHIFPALALSQALKRKDSDIDLLFITTSDVVKFKRQYNINFPIKRIIAMGLPDKIDLRIILFFLTLFIGIIKTIFILAMFRPEVVVGFGGYTSGPIVLGAFLLKIPIILHEQNPLPGRATLKLAQFAKKIAISWPQSKGYFKKELQQKIVLTGNPLRDSLSKIDRLKAIKKLNLDNNKFTILVMGGSQGAHRINDIICNTVSLMTEKEKSLMQIIHITGERDYKYINAEYRKLNLAHKAFSFYSEMEIFYSATDLIIARAGATTISEITFFGLPSVLIPYPYRAAHQRENARLLEPDAAFVIDEDKLSTFDLKRHILELIKNRSKLKNMSESASKVFMPNASDNLAEEVLKLGRP